MEGKSSATQDLFLFLGFLALLFILWVSTGGPEQQPRTRDIDRSELTDGQSFAREGRAVPENPYSIEEQLEDAQEELARAREHGTASPYEDMVEIRGGRGSERFAQTEYLELRALSGNNTNVPITGWTLESVVTGQRAEIGTAAALPYPGVVNTQTTLFLAPGEQVFVVTGSSPIGANFKVNRCVGYFEQFQNFSPSLRKECPQPVDEFDTFARLPVTNVRLERDEREICRDFIRREIGRCEINRVNLRTVEPRLNTLCRDFIEDTYTYQGCVANHQSDPGFFKNEWRVFLESPAELWREDREIIRLRDASGRIVDVYDY
jgi:hypothetical protein